MKKILFAIIAFSLCAFSCGKSSDQPDPVPEDRGTITVPDGESLAPVFGPGSETLKFRFRASMAWTAKAVNTKADSWLVISPSSGEKGDCEIVLSAAENTSPDDRSAAVEILCGEAKLRITATQKQKDALTVTKSLFELGKDGGTVEIEIKANVDYTVSVDERCASWIERDRSKAIVTSRVSFTVAANDSTEAREGKITVASGRLKEEITVSQSGEQASLVISRKDFDVRAEGEKIEVEVSHNVNVEYEITKGSDFVSEDTTKAMSTNSYFFLVAKNDSTDAREAEIRFFSGDRSLSETVRISQSQKDAIAVGKSSYEIGGDGGEIDITVGHNVEFDVEIGNDWISRADTKAYVEDRVSFTVARNIRSQAREGSVTFRSKDGKLSQTVRISQKEAVLYDLDRAFSKDMGVATFHAGGYDSQCFDIDSKGNVYFAFSKSLGQRGYMGIMRRTPQSEMSQEMIFYYSYHGTSFSVEEVGDDVYIWTSTFGTKGSDGTYGTSQMFCRVKFEPGKEYTPEQIAATQDVFYSSNVKNVNVSRDRITGRIAVQYAKSESYAGKSYTHRVDVFDAEKLLATSKRTVTTTSMKRGGDWKGPITTERTETSTVSVHDYSSLTPVSVCRYVNKEAYGTGPNSEGTSGTKAFQGFCFYDGYIYISADRNRYARDATLTKLKADGTQVHGPTHLKCVDDIDLIRSCGLVGTDTYLEVEGLQVIDGSLHFGCLSWDATGCFNSVINTYPRK